MSFRASIRPWTFRGITLTASLFAVAGLSASTAQAAPACTDEEQAAYMSFEVMGDLLADLGYVYGADPDAGDCEKICKTVSKACETAAKDVAKAAKNVGKALAKGAKTLCGSAVDEQDAKDCKADAKEDAKAAKDAVKALANDLAEVCGDPDLASACSGACNDDVFPESCGDVFGDEPV